MRGGAGGRIPDPAQTIEVGETAPAHRPRPQRGRRRRSTPPITWRAADPTVTVDEATGLVTGVVPGPAGFRRRRLALRALPVRSPSWRPPTPSIIVGDSVVVAAGRSRSVDRVRWSSGWRASIRAGPAGRPAGDLRDHPARRRRRRRSCMLSGDVQSDTVTTGTDGTATPSSARPRWPARFRRTPRSSRSAPTAPAARRARARGSASSSVFQ